MNLGDDGEGVFRVGDAGRSISSSSSSSIIVIVAVLVVTPSLLTSTLSSDLTVLLSSILSGDLAALGDGEGVQIREEGSDLLALEAAEGDRCFGVAG